MVTRPTTIVATPPSVAGGTELSLPAGARVEQETLPRVLLAELPAQGIVLDGGRGVRFVSLDGDVLARLPGSSIEAHHASPGRTVVRHERAFYVLRPAAGLLRRIRKEAIEEYVDHNERLRGIRPAATVEGRPAGSWRWGIESPDGSLVLAQWSGECEVPTAFFWSGDETPVVPITGERNLARAPESLALGWTFDGRAVALMREGACSTGTGPPGVYLFSGPGDSELAFEVPRGSLARMWGSAGAVIDAANGGA